MEVRPWGGFEILHESESLKIKTLKINPGQRISLQRHRWRDEHWFVVEGAGAITIFLAHNYGPTSLFAGDTIDIAKGMWHRIENTEQVPLVIVEVQTGDCFEEDIERKEDDYGRA